MAARVLRELGVDPDVIAAKKVTELSDGPIQGVGPVAGMFVPLWRSTNQLLLQIQRMLEPEPEEEVESNWPPLSLRSAERTGSTQPRHPRSGAAVTPASTATV